MRFFPRYDLGTVMCVVTMPSKKEIIFKIKSLIKSTQESTLCKYKNMSIIKDHAIKIPIILLDGSYNRTVIFFLF